MKKLVLLILLTFAISLSYAAGGDESIDDKIEKENKLYQMYYKEYNEVIKEYGTDHEKAKGIYREMVYRDYKQNYFKHIKAVDEHGKNSKEAKDAKDALARKTKIYGNSIPENKVETIDMSKTGNSKFDNLTVFDKLNYLEKINPDAFVSKKLEKRSFFDSIGATFRSLFNKKNFEDHLYDLDKLVAEENFEKAKELISKIDLTKLTKEQQEYFNSVQIMIAIKLGDEKLAKKFYSDTNHGDKTKVDNLIHDEKEKAKYTKLQNELKKLAKPYVDAHIQFHIAAADDVNKYREKLQKGNRAELHGYEYWTKFMNPKTFHFYSGKAYNEYVKIAGMNCVGLAQVMNRDMFKRAGIEYPLKRNYGGPRELIILGKKKKAIQVHEYKRYLNDEETDDLVDLDYYKKHGELKWRTDKIPPKGYGIGDIMYMKEHGDGQYWHSFVYMGKDEHGQILIANQSGSADGPKVQVIPDFYMDYLSGFIKINGADEAREKLSKL